MSSSNRLIINCGVSHVSASVFSYDDEDVTMEESYIQELEYNFTTESDWLENVAEAVEELCSENGLKGKAQFILPGFLLLTKLIKVPHVEEAKQKQIIAFEAEQNIPYPLEEVVWDSHVVSEDEVENEIMLLAIKKDIAIDFCNKMLANGLYPDSVGASSVLDFNTLKFSGLDEEEETLLINIGARSSNLLFSNSEGFLTRTINLGGNSLTQNIADSLGLSFLQAENIKTQYYSGLAEYSEDDPGVQVLDSSAATFMKRLNIEITRSIVTYKRQKKSSPAKILLTGKASLLPGLSEFLVEKQKIEIDYFSSVGRIELSSDIDEEEAQYNQFNLSEVVGAAVSGIGESDVAVNLLPQDFSNNQAFKKQKPFLIMAAALLAAVPVPHFLHAQKEASLLKEHIGNLGFEIPPLEKVLNETKEHTEKAEIYKQAIDEIEVLSNSKFNWIKFFGSTQEQLMGIKDVWLDSLDVIRRIEEPEEDGFDDEEEEEVEAKLIRELVVKGRILVRPKAGDQAGKSFDRDVLTDRINQLRKGFIASEFIKKENSYSTDFSKLDRGLNVLPFEMIFAINPEKPL